MKKIRVLIVDDSYFARCVISEALSSDSEILVVGEAENGLQAVALAGALHPDIITMDINMPEMGGFDAIRTIMARFPTPILVISDKSDVELGFHAVSLGALEVLDKARINDPGFDGLLYKVKFLSQVKVIRHMQESGRVQSAPATTAKQLHDRVVGIIASTGGPKALSLLLSSLPADFAAPILIVQHIGGEFIHGLVSFLNSMTALQVQLAKDKEPLAAGHVYVAPAEKHLTLGPERTAALSDRGAGDIHVPSCDRLFFSLADHSGACSIGVVLTGMGRDGTLGARALIRKNGIIFVQNETTSTVFGMPLAVIEAGCATEVLPLGDIPRALMKALRKGDGV